ncbi:MAG: glycosyltransferase family 4 protein [Anaerolineales bacterium]
MMRVAMLTQRYLPHIGGAERQIQSLAPLLRRRGVDVVVLTRRESGLAKYESIDGTPVYRLPAAGPKPIAAISFMVSSSGLLRKLDVDIVHAHELLSPGSIAALAKILYGYPVVAKVLRGGHLGDLHKIRRGSFAALRIGLLRRTVDIFIAISSEIQAELAGLGIPAARCALIPNGVDVDRFHPVLAQQKAMLRQIMGLPSEVPIVLYAGRLVPEKRIVHLISTWPAIRSAVPDAMLIIAGSGSEADKLGATAGPGIRLIGEIPDVAPLLQCADAFVLPSVTEGLSGALLEALASGLPVIATSVGGAPDVIRHMESGYLIPPNNVQELQQALLTLLSDSSLRARLGECGRQRTASAYSLELVADRLANLYRGLLPSSNFTD